MIYVFNDIQIKAYGNGSFSYWHDQNKRWLNIPSELAKKIIKLYEKA